MQDLSLAKLDEVFSAIEAAITVQEIKDSLDVARVAEVYAKQAKLGNDIEVKASEYIIRAERKLGEMLVGAKAAGQIGKGKPFQKHNVPDENIMKFTLEEVGISRKLSSRAQKIAAVPKDDFEKRILELKEAGKLTSKMVTRSVRANGEKPRGKIQRGPREPEISMDVLSMTAQQKLGLAIRQHKERLQAEFNNAINARIDELLENTIGPQLAKREKEARRIIEARSGIMDRKTYRKIRSCLHPDWITDPKQKQYYEDAFRLFTVLEKLLLDEKDSPTPSVGIPKTRAEWDELKRQANEQRKAKRSTTAKSVQKS